MEILVRTRKEKTTGCCPSLTDEPSPMLPGSKEILTVP
jgi:hypothetical protein